eukprot:GFUD01045132.1.p1 GENE.GFUD01045132.1~~GFUD01045132.1.p1  ORF type:complete len:543 (+),score=189.01 GFUD01045132.1:159-1787(+)
MSSKLTFRARTLDSSRPLAIYLAQDLPELVDLNSINRAVPALPTGMEKEEETEKHLQDILVAQGQGQVGNTMMIPTPECTNVIPTPECDTTTMSPNSQYHKLYRTEFKQPRQYIHVQPFGPSQDLPEYDMDEEDLKFFQDELRDRRKLEVSNQTFEDMIDRLEKNSTQNVVTLKEAKLILKEDDDLILVVYDYWLNKRLAVQQSLMPGIKTMNISTGQPHSPYIAFRRRTEKMQTRKNRKNEEASYEAMLKLRRDLSRAVTLLEMVKRREKTKKEKLNLTLDVFDKRYGLKDFDGKLVDYASLCRPKSVQPLNIQNWMSMGSPQPKRTTKKRKHHRSGQRSIGEVIRNDTSQAVLDRQSVEKIVSSEDETVNVGSDEETVENSPFLFRRKEGVQYLAPVDEFGSSWDRNTEDKSEAFLLTSIPITGTVRCLGFCRRRMGRGGRVVMDRIKSRWDNIWEEDTGDLDLLGDEFMVRPVTPPNLEDMDWDPYMVRGQEVKVGLQLDKFNTKGFRIVDMNKAVAHNAAGALVDSQFVDLFSTAHHH